MKNEPLTMDDSLRTLHDAKTAASRLIESEGAMRAEHGALLKQVKEIHLSNASEGEIHANIDRLVSETAAKFAAARAVSFARSLGGHRQPRLGPTPFRDMAPTLPRFGLESTLSFDDLCGLAPELMKARLREIVQGVRFGLDTKARVAKVAALDAQILELEERHTRMCESAAEVGLSLPLLARVAKRREDEARAAKEAADLAANRARGFHAVYGPSAGA